MTAQAGFVAALLGADLPVPDGLADPMGGPAGRRFAVYRNTLAVGLRSALAEGFPLLRQLVGPEFFDAMAGVFLRQHLPQSRLLWQYGAQMPAFLRAFPPVAHLPYLPDVARLELALRRSYHAADAAPMPADELSAIPPAWLLQSRLHLAPALRLVRSDWPLHGIWQAHATGTTPPAMAAQDVVILRPVHDPAPHLLTPGGADFIAALLAGNTVAVAIDAGGAGHDLNTTLALLLAGGAIVGLMEDEA